MVCMVHEHYRMYNYPNCIQTIGCISENVWIHSNMLMTATGGRRGVNMKQFLTKHLDFLQADIA